MKKEQEGDKITEGVTDRKDIQAEGCESVYDDCGSARGRVCVLAYDLNSVSYWITQRVKHIFIETHIKQQTEKKNSEKREVEIQMEQKTGKYVGASN